MSKRRAGRRSRGKGSADPAIKAGVVISLALGDLACARPGTQEAPAATVVLSASSSSAAAPVATAVPGNAAEKLRPYIVTNKRFARRTLFTWTTREQVEALAKDRVLLTRSESPTHGLAYVDQVIIQRAAAGDRLAALLRTSAFTRARFGWPVPFATYLGWPGEHYGDELIRIDLRYEAWIAKLRTATNEWEVVDMDDHPVAIDEVLKHPERLAAVYFVQDTPRSTGRMSTFEAPAKPDRMAYREYMICNESMIERWSTGTAEIAREMIAEAEALEALGNALAREKVELTSPEAWNARVALSIWPGATEIEGSSRALYEATLAMPNELYQPEAAKIAQTAQKMRELSPKGPGIEHRPTTVFPAASSVPVKAPPPPQKPKRRYGSY
ncbi:MAG: hypothetical protein QM820_57640 [Minicystis sp.]